MPRQVRELLVRGLAPRPADRFANMRALLHAMGRVRGAWRRRAWAAGVAGVACAAAVLVGRPRAAPPDTCDSPETTLGGLWDPEQRARARAGVMATAAPYARVTWEHLAPQLDDYATRWAAAQHAHCLARARGDAVRERRQARCLDTRRYALRAYLDTLAEADTTVVSTSIRALRSLPELGDCADPELRDDPVPPPPDGVSAAVEAARSRLAWIRAQQEMGRDASTVEPAKALLRRVEPLDYLPLTIDVRTALGRALGKVAASEAEGVLEQAYFDARALGLERAASLAAMEQVVALGPGLGRYQDALRWVEHARALIERLRDDALERHYQYVLGTVHTAGGEHREALGPRERALAMALEVYEPDSLPVARAEGELAATLRSLGRYAEAESYFERSRSTLEATLGPLHPELAKHLNHMGSLQRLMGNFARALDYYDRALEIERAVLGPRSIDVAHLYNNMGTVKVQQGELEEAEALFQRSLDIHIERLGPRHHSLMSSLGNLAEVDRRFGRLDDARAKLVEAREIIEEHFGADSPKLRGILGSLGSVYGELGQLERATELSAQALRIAEAELGPDSPQASRLLTNLAVFQSKRGLHRLAVQNIARALDGLSESLGPGHHQVGRALRFQARVFERAGDHARALDSLRRAVDILDAALGPEHPMTLESRGLMGLQQLELGQVSSALAELERARAGLLATTKPYGETVLARILFGIARALGSRGRERAVRLARRAQRICRDIAAPDECEIREPLERWLRTHAGGA